MGQDSDAVTPQDWHARFWGDAVGLAAKSAVLGVQKHGWCLQEGRSLFGDLLVRSVDVDAALLSVGQRFPFVSGHLGSFDAAHKEVCDAAERFRKTVAFGREKGFLDPTYEPVVRRTLRTSDDVLMPGCDTVRTFMELVSASMQEGGRNRI